MVALAKLALWTVRANKYFPAFKEFATVRPIHINHMMRTRKGAGVMHSGHVLSLQNVLPKLFAILLASTLAANAEKATLSVFQGIVKNLSECPAKCILTAGPLLSQITKHC